MNKQKLAISLLLLANFWLVVAYAEEISTPSLVNADATKIDDNQRWKIYLTEKNTEKKDFNVVIELDSELELKDEYWQGLKYGGYLPLLLSLEIYMERWYWLDKQAVNVKLPIRISYNNLRNYYRVRIFGKNKTYKNAEQIISEALRFKWTALPTAIIPAGEYKASLTLSVDHKSLPKLLQVDATTNRVWQWKAKFKSRNIKIPQH